MTSELAGLPASGPDAGGLFRDLWRQGLYPRASRLLWWPACMGREEGCAVDDDGDRGPPFFLSYAHVADGLAGTGEVLDPGGYVSKFFRELAQNVALITPPQAGRPAGFMDQGMRGGEDWNDELLHAVGTCQILVALLSASYLESRWCRMEWHAFSLRTVRRIPGTKVSPRRGCIVPVIWTPFHAAPPEHIRLVQTFSPEPDPEPQANRHYQANGVIGLMKMQRLTESYEIVAWQLAMHIADVYHSQRTEQRRFEAAELRSVLEDDCHAH